MKKLLNWTLSILCAVMLLISAVSAWAAAEEEPATATDLIPSEEGIIPEDSGKEPEPEGETGEEGIISVEVVITKTLTVGQSWEGKMKKTKPAVLKLDVTRPCTVYMLVEGKDVWATVEKSDRQTEDPDRTQTDPETDQTVISWNAEEGSYLITLGPVEPNLLAMATVSFMNQTSYSAWEEEQAEKESEPEELGEEPEQKPEEESETEPAKEENELDENVTESDEPEDESVLPDAEEEKPENDSEDVPAQRYIEVITYDDTPYPVIGDIAHFRATLYGYEDLNYTVQWQYSADREIWNDIPNETELSMDIAITRENNVPYWRIVVYVEEDQES